jgi:hypothetical protein
MRVLDTVLYNDIGVSLHQHVSKVILTRINRILSFYLRYFAIHFDEVNLADVGRCIFLFILDYIRHVFIIIILFILCYYIYSFSLPYARFVVRTWRN